MFFLWSFATRFPRLVFFTGALYGVLLLCWAALPDVYGDYPSYPAEIAGRYQGVGVYLPYFLGYMIMALPFLITEQQRQFAALGHALLLPPEGMEALKNKLVDFKISHSLLGLFLGFCISISLGFKAGHFDIEGLTYEQQIRRSAYFVMPGLAWWGIIEILALIWRIRQIINELIFKRMCFSQVSDEVAKPFVGLFSNSALFVSCAAIGVPILWYGGKMYTYDLAVYAAIMAVIAAFLFYPIWVLRTATQKHQIVFTGKESTLSIAGGVVGDIDDDNFENVEDDLLSKFGNYLLGSEPFSDEKGLRSSVILLFRFYLILIAPVIVWGISYLAWQAMGL